MGKIRQKIDLPLYFDVIAKLPGIDKGEVEQAEEVFADAFDGEIPDKLTFDRGSASGDGKIYAYQKSTDEFGRVLRSKLYLDDSGNLSNAETGFTAKVPFLVARYFMSSLFGMEELSKDESQRFPVRDNLFAQEQELTFGASNPWQKDASPKSVDISKYREGERVRHLNGHLPAIFEGAGKLYQCASGKGSINRCGKSEGAQMIASVYHALEAKIWYTVENFHGMADGKSEKAEIAALMEDYGECRTKLGSKDSLNGAIKNYDKALELIGELVKRDHMTVGFENQHCEVMNETPMTSNSRKVEYVCDYGIQHAEERFNVINFFD